MPVAKWLQVGTPRIITERLFVNLFRTTRATPFGPVQITVDDDGVLVELLLPGRRLDGETVSNWPRGAQEGARIVGDQLSEYFARKRRDFDLRLNPPGSKFERIVWERLLTIPYGKTTSYGKIAAELGLVNGARAVGRANGADPIPIVIPCHRVIGMDGTLTGYGGGLPLKQALLELEGALAPEALRFL